jgi:hypothetical protein
MRAGRKRELRLCLFFPNVEASPSFDVRGFDMPKKKPSNAMVPDVRAPEPGDEFLTTQQAATILKRSTKTLEFWRLLNKGPRFYKQGRVVRYLRSELFQWAMGQPRDTRDTAA